MYVSTGEIASYSPFSKSVGTATLVTSLTSLTSARPKRPRGFSRRRDDEYNGRAGLPDSPFDPVENGVLV